MGVNASVTKKLNRWLVMAGLDFHIVFTLFLRGWTVFAGGLTIFLLPLGLSPVEQGYYFSFSSLLALQVFFELGLNQIVVQQVSHEVAYLREVEEGQFHGGPAHVGRLTSLLKFLKKWYATAAVFFALFAAVAGVFFYAREGSASPGVWMGPWFLMVMATSGNLWLSPGLAVLEGAGKVGQVARLRLTQSLLGIAFFWGLLFSGAGLWAAPAVPLLNVICTGYWLRTRRLKVDCLAPDGIKEVIAMHWRTDILPLQWRIALSWVSGYLIFNLFTTVVFSRFGPIEAGRLGLALTVFSAISSVGMSWINAN
ncbi:MAG: hypothetical protein HYZ45_12150 [Burkholderiales bacterium]|nr:hypothetical protein [Burkholderiales bacterium]